MTTTTTQTPRLSGPDRARIERARQVLAQPHVYDIASLSARIGVLEWWQGDILNLVAELNRHATTGN